LKHLELGDAEVRLESTYAVDAFEDLEIAPDSKN